MFYALSVRGVLLCADPVREESFLAVPIILNVTLFLGMNPYLSTARIADIFWFTAAGIGIFTVQSAKKTIKQEEDMAAERGVK